MHDELEGGRRFSEVLDGARGNWSQLSDLAFLVSLEETEPFSQLSSLRDVDEWDSVLGGESFYQFLVFLLFAVFSEEDELSFLPVNGFDDFVQTVDESVVDLGLLDDLWEFSIDGLLSFSFFSWYFNFTIRYNQLGVLYE